MIQRQHSESGASSFSHGGTGSTGTSRRWRLPILRRIPSSIRKVEDKSWSTRSNDSESHDSLGLHSHETSSSAEGSNSSYRQLRDIIQRVRAAPSSTKEVDAAYEVYIKHKDRASALCHAILQEEFRPRNMSNVTEIMMPRRDSSVESPSALYDHRSSFSGRSLSEVVTGSAGGGAGGGGGVGGGRGGPHANEAWLAAIRDWKTYLETLAETIRTNLAETYKKHESDATPEMVEAMFTDKRYRKEAVYRMRNASVTRVMSQDPQFFPRYEIRFRNYEKVKAELVEIRSLLQSGESGISPDRQIDDYPIAPHGDSVLEFANINPDATYSESVLRFRVSSHLLAKTSPIFSHMFTGKTSQAYPHDDDDVHLHLPPPATKYTCRDGSETKLYRMPQMETNRLQCLEILFHAAHGHHDMVPQEVSFEQFVAIAECCLRYKCTSPLENIVDLKWLPTLMHNGADDRPDGMLAISYAFGLRQMFTRMSASIILNLVDEAELQSKPWPQKLKSKIWAVRCAKMAQVYACCNDTIQEYIRQPARNPADDVAPITPADLRTGHHHQHSAAVLPKTPRTTLSSTPRCPKGSHWCDASNLGWMMLVYNEMNLLPQILRPNALSHLMEEPGQQAAPRSLAQVVEALRRVPSPVSPIHQGGVCDPIPAFRAAINDIFNSVSGLTLYDVSCKSHGWALSKNKASEPQETATWGLTRMAVYDRNHHSVATEFPENVRLKILSYIGDLDDLHAAAMINRVYYGTYKTHELYLMRNILRSGRIRSGGRAPTYPILPKSISNAEEKVPKEVSDEMKESSGARVADPADQWTLRSEDDDEDEDDDYDEFDDGESVDGTPAPSITESLWMETRLRQARSRLAEHHSKRLRAMQQEPVYGAPPTHPPPQVPVTAPTSTATTTTTNSMTDRGFYGSEDLTAFITATPTSSTPRQGSPHRSPLDDDDQASPKSTFVVSEVPYNEEPLTEEEARRILWPDDSDLDKGTTTTSGRPSALRPEDGLREKFRFGDKSFTEGLEDKSLALIHEEKKREQ